MLRKNTTMLVSFVLLATLLSLSVAAQAYANAGSSSASAWSTGNGILDIDASASISNLIDCVGGVQQGKITYASASGYASDLRDIEHLPATQSRAGYWDGHYEASDSWSAK